jgi:hypothetical protein
LKSVKAWAHSGQTLSIKEKESKGILVKHNVAFSLGMKDYHYV